MFKTIAKIPFLRLYREFLTKDYHRGCIFSKIQNFFVKFEFHFLGSLYSAKSDFKIYILIGESPFYGLYIYSRLNILHYNHMVSFLLGR